MWEIQLDQHAVRERAVVYSLRRCNLDEECTDFCKHAGSLVGSDCLRVGIGCSEELLILDE